MTVVQERGMLHSRRVVVASVILLVSRVAIAPRVDRPLFSLLSGLIETAIGILVAVAFVQAGQRSGRFGRQFWMLLSSAFGVWSLGHIFTVYQRDVRHTADLDYWPTVILFFFFALPFALALFLDEDVGERFIDWQQTLDSVQIGILMLAAFLAFSYIPFLRDPSRAALMGRSIGWHVVRDGALVLAFAARSLFSHSPAVRTLFRRMAFFLALYGVVAVLFFYGQVHWAASTQLFLDVVTDGIRVVAIMVAATWLEPELPVAAGSTSHQRSTELWAQLLLFPMLVLIMAPRIATERRGIAVLVVCASFLCYSARFFVTQMEARKATEALKESQARFRTFAAGISSGMGTALFESLVLRAADATGATYTLVGELKPNAGDAVRTLAFAKDGELIPNCDYDLRNTPCENVIGQQLCHYPRNVANLFPQDHMLAEMRVQSYMGAPLVGSSGEALGLFAVLNKEPIKEPELAKSIVLICASRAATELERMRAEEALRASREIFTLAFKQSPNIVILGQFLDGKWVFVDVNDAAVRFFGGSRDEMIGKNGPELKVWVHTEQQELFINDLIKHGQVMEREVLLRRKSGEHRTTRLSAGLLQMGGQTWGLVTGRDITLEKTANEALQISEAKYRDLFENANDFIFTSRPTGEFLSINKAGQALCGLAMAEALSRKVADLLTAQSASVYQENISQLLGTMQARTFEVDLQRSPAGTTLLELALRPILEEGTVVAVQGIGRNVTERRLLERKLLQSQKMEAVGTLAGGIAHDFNNLLTVITGYSQLANNSESKSDQLAEDLSQIQQAARRAATLTSQLLSFSRQHVSERVVFSLNDSVKGMEKMLRSIIGEDVELQTKLDPGISFICADPTQIDQVIMNLTVNARDAMPTGGTLRFVTSNLRLQTQDKQLSLSPGGYVMLTAKDTGSGMDQATLARIFEPFFTTKDVGKGTGLGLSTVYGIVQQVGGQITVASELGRGTTFTLYFPAVHPEEAEQPRTQIELSAVGSETLLLVEDDAALRSLAQRVLESAGYTIYSAAGVEEANRIAQEISGPIDMVVTDVVMPDGDGVAFVSKLAKTRPHIKVLFMSGYTDGKVPREYLAGDRPSFIAKPFEPAQLAKKVRQVLDSEHSVVAGHQAI